MVLGEAGFDDGGFLLLVVVVEDGHLVAGDGELHVFAEGDVGGLGPGEVELLADDVGLGVSLDGEDLVGVGVAGGVGGAAEDEATMVTVKPKKKKKRQIVFDDAPPAEA